MKIKRLTIIGCGLIGGSIAAAAKYYRLVEQVMGMDVHAGMVRMALQRNVIDEGTTQLDTAVADADLIVLAVPVKQALPILESMEHMTLKPGVILTDVGGTKAEICEFAKTVLPPDVQFIGGHPMAGSERSGVRAADEHLFENAMYVLTPDASVSKEALQTLTTFVEGLRAKVVLMDPYHHDQVVGTISHLPHVIASALVRFVAEYAEQDSLYAQLAAGGFRDVTRIASGNPDMWRDILLSNAHCIDEVLTAFIQSCTEIRDWVRQHDVSQIYDFLAQAKTWRDALPIRKRGAVPNLYQCTVEVPDRPGMIAHIAAILAEHEISLRNIGILESREEENGQLVLQFNRMEELDRAVDVLTQKNMQVHVYDES
jgi:prephenate dehydrogenase